MSLEIKDIMKRYHRDRSARQPIIDERIMDMVFARWSQNEDLMSEISTNEFIGQFDIISRERRRIQAELRQNDIEVKFRNKRQDNDDIDEIMQGKYRTDRRASKSRQCYKIAQDDQVDVGFGAWRLVTEYEDDVDELSTNLEIRREPIAEAVRRVFFDANSYMADKSDASCCSVITAFTEDGYKKFLEENDVKTEDQTFISFDQPYQSLYETAVGYATEYPLYDQSEKTLSLLEFYNLEPKKTTYFLFVDEAGQPYSVKKEYADEMGEPIRKKTITEVECWKYITNGIDILKRTRVPGGKIPIIPVYGERNFVKGYENFYGIVKSAKDPQCLINSVYNYLTSMMMFSPVPRPEFDPREIDGLEDYHEGCANSHELAYNLRHKQVYDDASGQFLNFSTPTYTQPPQIPPAVAALMGNLPGMTESILNPGVTEDAFNTQASGVALDKIVDQMNIQTFIYLDNYAESMRRDGEVYAAMASEIFDAERTIIVTNLDGTTQESVINEEVLDLSMMDMMNIDMMALPTTQRNKLSGERFEVMFDVGPSYQSKREATLANLKELYQSLPDGDPMKKVIQLTIISKEQGEGLDELNKYARYDLLAQGLPGFEPQTDDERKFVAELMQARTGEAQQGDPMMNIMMQQAITERMQTESKNRNETLETQAKIREMMADARYKLAKAEEIELKNQSKMAGLSRVAEDISMIEDIGDMELGR